MRKPPLDLGGPCAGSERGLPAAARGSAGDGSEALGQVSAGEGSFAGQRAV